MNLKRELMNFILLISHYLTQVYIEEIINISYIDKNEISKIGIMNILISLENHPNILQMNDYINNMIITLSNDQNYRVRMIVTDKINLILKFNNCPNNIKQNSIDIFSQLLESQESKIRNKCCQRIEEISKILYQEENFEQNIN